MQVSVRLFGAVGEAAGAKELRMRVDDGARVAELREQLARRIPLVEEYGERLRIAVNQELAESDRPLADGDEVALLPPVSGGAVAARRCLLSDRPLDVGAVVDQVVGPGIGGIVTFVGSVRDASRGHEIRHLEYEAYPGMAEAEMEKIAVEAEARWPGVKLAMAHRYGHLEIGDIAVAIVAGAPHRAEAFEACRFAIDTLKQTVPIWKKEVAVSGEYWVDDHA